MPRREPTTPFSDTQLMDHLKDRRRKRKARPSQAVPVAEDPSNGKLDADTLLTIFQFAIASVKHFFPSPSVHWCEMNHAKGSHMDLCRPFLFPYRDFHVLHQRTALALVCRQWARVVLSSSWIASRSLDVSFEPLLLKSLSSLAGSTPVVLDIDSVWRGNQANYYRAIRDLTFVEGLKYEAGKAHDLEKALRKPAPRLKVLVIRSWVEDYMFRWCKLDVFEADQPFLGDRESALRHLVLEGCLLIPSPSNPAFKNLVTLKMGTRASHMRFETVLPWFVVAKDLQFLEEVSFRGLKTSDQPNGVNIQSELGNFPLPPRMKQFTIGGDVEPCAMVVKSVSIPRTCNVRLLIGSHFSGPDLRRPDPDVLREMAHQFALVWKSDCGQAPCQAIEMVLDAAGSSHNRALFELDDYLSLTHTGPPRKVEIVFGRVVDKRSYMPGLVRAFAEDLAIDTNAAPVFSGDSWLHLRFRIPRVPDIDDDPQYPKSLRMLLCQWKYVKNVRILRYESFGREWEDRLGLFGDAREPSSCGIFEGARCFSIFKPLLENERFGRAVKGGKAVERGALVTSFSEPDGGRALMRDRYPYEVTVEIKPFLDLYCPQ